jgi:hypothetical protein
MNYIYNHYYQKLLFDNLIKNLNYLNEKIDLNNIFL